MARWTRNAITKARHGRANTNMTTFGTVAGATEGAIRMAPVKKIILDSNWGKQGGRLLFALFTYNIHTGRFEEWGHRSTTDHLLFFENGNGDSPQQSLADDYALYDWDSGQCGTAQALACREETLPPPGEEIIPPYWQDWYDRVLSDAADTVGGWPWWLPKGFRILWSGNVLRNLFVRTEDDEGDPEVALGPRCELLSADSAPSFADSMRQHFAARVHQDVHIALKYSSGGTDDAIGCEVVYNMNYELNKNLCIGLGAAGGLVAVGGQNSTYTRLDAVCRYRSDWMIELDPGFSFDLTVTPHEQFDNNDFVGREGALQFGATFRF